MTAWRDAVAVGAAAGGDERLAELRQTLATAGYTVDRVVAAMGPLAHAALARNHTVPAERALTERALTERDDALATLIRLWPLQRPVDRAAVEAALPGVEGGMKPKLAACIEAIRGGTGSAHSIDGRRPHSLLLEVFTSDGIGTMVLPDEEVDDE